MSNSDEFVKAAETFLNNGVKVTETSETVTDTPQKVTETVTKEQPNSDSNSDFKLNFDRISKQDKMNRDARKVLEDKRKAFDADKEELEKYRSFDKELKVNPLGVLEKLGLSYDRIQQLAQQKQNPKDPAAIEALELAKSLKIAMEEERERLKEEKYSLEEQKLQNRISEEIRNNEYDVIEHFGAQDSVKEFMEEYYDQTGQIPSIKIACEAVLQSLVEKVNKAKGSKWLRQQEEIHEPSPKQSSFKTITNKASQSTTRSVKPQTDDERMAAAIALL